MGENLKLSDDQRMAMEESEVRSSSALAQLGVSYLEYTDAESRYLKTKANLTKHRASAVEMEILRGNIISAISAEMSVPPGEWVYSREDGSLIRKDS